MTLLVADLALWLVVYHVWKLTPRERNGPPGEDERGAAVRVLDNLLRLDEVGAFAVAVAPAGEVPGSGPPTGPARDQRPPEEPPVDAALPDEDAAVDQGEAVPEELGSARQEGLQEEPVPHEPLLPVRVEPRHLLQGTLGFGGGGGGEALLALHAPGEVCRVGEVEGGRAQHLVHHGQEGLVLLLLAPGEVVDGAAVGEDVGLGQLVDGVVGVGEVAELPAPLDDDEVRPGDEVDDADDAVELLGLGDAVDGDGEAVGDGDVAGDAVDDEEAAGDAGGGGEEVGVGGVEQVQGGVEGSVQPGHGEDDEFCMSFL